MGRRSYSVSLPINRPFSWRAVWILAIVLFFGNLAGIPLQRATNTPIEPVWQWAVIMSISTVLIGVCLLLATRTGLGAPLVEGLLPEDEKGRWAGNVLAWAILTASVGSLIIILGNLKANPRDYPAALPLILAAVKAGVQEEIFMRVVLMSFVVWVGRFVGKDRDGLPTPAVYLTAIVVSALLFGYSHVESSSTIPGARAGVLMFIMASNTSFGLVLGWLYWKLGLEAAILTHFLIDAFASAAAVPAYFSGNTLIQVTVLGSMIFGCGWSLRVLSGGGKDS